MLHGGFRFRISIHTGDFRLSLVYGSVGSEIRILMSTTYFRLRFRVYLAIDYCAKKTLVLICYENLIVLQSRFSTHVSLRCLKRYFFYF